MVDTDEVDADADALGAEGLDVDGFGSGPGVQPVKTRSPTTPATTVRDTPFARSAPTPAYSRKTIVALPSPAPTLER
jgi:hypothetical protein